MPSLGNDEGTMPNEWCAGGTLPEALSVTVYNICAAMAAERGMAVKFTETKRIYLMGHHGRS